MSDGVAQDLWILYIGVDINPWGPYQPLITTDHKEGEQLEDRRNVGESSCNSGDGTDQRVQSLMFMMMKRNKQRVSNTTNAQQVLLPAQAFCNLLLLF